VTEAHPSASFSATLRVRLPDRPGSFARLAGAIGAAGGLLGAIDLARVERHTKVRDVTVLAADAAQIERIVAAVRELDGSRSSTSPTGHSSFTSVARSRLR
jgi:malate dehydrogenase (oxaloacetate-decarboxylating)